MEQPCLLMHNVSLTTLRVRRLEKEGLLCFPPVSRCLPRLWFLILPGLRIFTAALLVFVLAVSIFCLFWGCKATSEHMALLCGVEFHGITD